MNDCRKDLETAITSVVTRLMPWEVGNIVEALIERAPLESEIAAAYRGFEASEAWGLFSSEERREMTFRSGVQFALQLKPGTTPGKEVS